MCAAGQTSAASLNCLSAECSIESLHSVLLLGSVCERVSIAFRLNAQLKACYKGATVWASSPRESQLPFG